MTVQPSELQTDTLFFHKQTNKQEVAFRSFAWMREDHSIFDLGVRVMHFYLHV